MLNQATNKQPRMAAYKTDLFAEIQSLEDSLASSSRQKAYSMLLNALLLAICIGLIAIIFGGFIAISAAFAALAIFLAYTLLGVTS